MKSTRPARLHNASNAPSTRGTVTSELLEEHGWTLGSSGVGVVIVAVLATSILTQMLG